MVPSDVSLKQKILAARPRHGQIGTLENNLVHPLVGGIVIDSVTHQGNIPDRSRSGGRHARQPGIERGGENGIRKIIKTIAGDGGRGRGSTGPENRQVPAKDRALQIVVEHIDHAAGLGEVIDAVLLHAPGLLGHSGHLRHHEQHETHDGNRHEHFDQRKAVVGRRWCFHGKATWVVTS
jgi:hypothetical protein